MQGPTNVKRTFDIKRQLKVARGFQGSPYGIFKQNHRTLKIKNKEGVMKITNTTEYLYPYWVSGLHFPNLSDEEFGIELRKVQDIVNERVSKQLQENSDSSLSWTSLSLAWKLHSKKENTRHVYSNVNVQENRIWRFIFKDEIDQAILKVFHEKS